MTRKITRRDFIKLAAVLGGVGAILLPKFFNRKTALSPTELPTTPHNLPTEKLMDTPTQVSTPSKPVSRMAGVKYPGSVVQVHSTAVHDWNYTDPDYWSHVHQGVVDRMVDGGVMNLTGKNDIADAWRDLLPGYLAGQLIAIKVSFNNTNDETGSQGMIDGIIEPVNSIIRGLNQAGIPEESIVVFDSSRVLPNRFTVGCKFNVHFKDLRDNPWGQTGITFHPPNVAPFSQSVSDVVANAAYLINMPILKRHGMAGISMGMKNHYGTIQHPEDIHDWSSLSSPYYSSSYSPITEINQNPAIAEKTILVVGDAIFAAFHNTAEASFPARWDTFGNHSPGSLFFATDPVAIDCVMGDYLNQEAIKRGRGEINPNAFDHLQLAADGGLGVFDRGNPWQKDYSKIVLNVLEL